MSDQATDRLLMDLLEIARARAWEIRTVHQTAGKLSISKFQVSARATDMRNSPGGRAELLLLQGLLNIDPQECEFISHEVRANGEWVMDVIWVPSQWHSDDGSRPLTESFENDGGPYDGKPRMSPEPAAGRWEKQHGSYIVTFTPEGSRCSCAWAQTHEDDKTGATAPCSHQQLAAWVRLRWYDKHRAGEPWPQAREDQLRKEIERADQEAMGDDRPAGR